MIDIMPRKCFPEKAFIISTDGYFSNKLPFAVLYLCVYVGRYVVMYVCMH